MKWVFFILSSLFAASEDESHHLLRLKWISDLQFGVAVQGDLAKTISPDASSFSGAASVEVSGRPHSTYNLLLPANRVALHNTIFECNDKIWITEFRSNPPVGVNGKLDGSGRQTVYIGATREAISPHQPRGRYRGSFLVTAVYP